MASRKRKVAIGVGIGAGVTSVAALFTILLTISGAHIETSGDLICGNECVSYFNFTSDKYDIQVANPKNVNLTFAGGISDSNLYLLNGVNWDSWNYTNFTFMKGVKYQFKFVAHKTNPMQNVKWGIGIAGSEIDPTLIGACGWLNNNYTTYISSSNLTSTGTCLQVNASNIIIDGNGTYLNYSVNYGINVSSGINVTIKNFGLIQNISSGEYGVFATGGDRKSIVNNTFLGKGIAISSTSTNDVIANNTLNITDSAIPIYLFTYFTTISNNTINVNHPYSYAIRLDNSQSATIVNNTIQNVSQVGIYIQVGNHTIDSNIINGSQKYGIQLFYSAGWAYGPNIIRNNIIEQSYPNSIGIYEMQSQYHQYINNTIKNTGISGKGIYLRWSSSDNFTNNFIVVNSTTGYGIHTASDRGGITYPAGNITVTGGSIISSNYYSYLVDDSFPTFTNTNFTVQRGIELPTGGIFIYSNGTGLPVVNTSCSACAFLNRTIVTWNSTNVTWTETPDYTISPSTNQINSNQTLTSFGQSWTETNNGVSTVPLSSITIQDNSSWSSNATLASSGVSNTGAGVSFSPANLNVTFANVSSKFLHYENITLNKGVSGSLKYVNHFTNANSIWDGLASSPFVSWVSSYLNLTNSSSYWDLNLSSYYPMLQVNISSLSSDTMKINTSTDYSTWTTESTGTSHSFTSAKTNVTSLYVRLINSVPSSDVVENLTNGRMETWSAGPSAAPDNWTFTYNCGTPYVVYQNSTFAYEGSYSVGINGGGCSAPANLTQNVLNSKYLGHNLNLSARGSIVEASVNFIRIGLDDGTSTTWSNELHFPGGAPAWNLMSLTKIVSPSAAKLNIILQYQWNNQAFGAKLFDLINLTCIDCPITTPINVDVINITASLNTSTANFPNFTQGNNILNSTFWGSNSSLVWLSRNETQFTNNTMTYFVTGLSPGFSYSIYNTTLGVATNKYNLTADISGLLNFTELFLNTTKTLSFVKIGSLVNAIICSFGTGIYGIEYHPYINLNSPPNNTNWLWVNATNQTSSVPLYSCKNVDSTYNHTVQIQTNFTTDNSTDTCATNTIYSNPLNLTLTNQSIWNNLRANNFIRLFCKRGYNSSYFDSSDFEYNVTGV